MEQPSKLLTGCFSDSDEDYLNSWRDKTVRIDDGVKAGHLGAPPPSQRGSKLLSSGFAELEKEMKIREELEDEIERVLEEEIKEGICHLALKLHRVYQQQKERKDKHGTKKKTLAGVYIEIKLEGGTKIEFKEIKKETCDRSRPVTSQSEGWVSSIPNNKHKKFDWVNSLRSDKGPATINSTNESSPNDRGRMLKHHLHTENPRKGSVSATRSGQNKESLLKMGWTN